MNLEATKLIRDNNKPICLGETGTELIYRCVASWTDYHIHIYTPSQFTRHCSQHNGDVELR